MRRPADGESGYTLVGLMVAVAVVNVSLAVAVTSTRTLGQRAREADLIWRGQQISRAIGCYEQADAGEPLVRLEQLVEANCLRRVYRDPMTSGGQWRILRQQDVADGTVAALQGIGADTGDGAVDGAAAAAGSASGVAGVGMTTPAILGGGVASTGAAVPGQSRSSFTPGAGRSRLQQSNLRLSASSTSGQDVIVGVVSSSAETSLRVYGDRTEYRAWVFLGGQAAGAANASPALPGRGLPAASPQGLLPRR